MSAKWEGARVAIVDDDVDQSSMVKCIAEDAGLVPVVLPFRRYDSVGDLVTAVKQSAVAAICDHRLTNGGMARFYGAEAVAQLVKEGIPAVLLTQFAETDADVSIRKWRVSVASVLSRSDATPESLLEALNNCKLEMDGAPPADRKSFDALLRVVGEEQIGSDRVVEVFVTQWRAHQAVRFPLSIFPVGLQDKVKAGTVWLASVNIAADRPSDLFFSDLRPAPPKADLP